MENKNISPMLTSNVSVREALGILSDPKSTPEDRQNSQQILRNVGREKVREIKSQMMRTGDYAAPEPNLKKGGKVYSKKMMQEGGLLQPVEGYNEITDPEKAIKRANRISKMEGDADKQMRSQKNSGLKDVPADKKGSLGKLPESVRNDMGYKKAGGSVKKKMAMGGKVAYKAKGGKVAPRGCGVAMRGYGKAMKKGK